MESRIIHKLWLPHRLTRHIGSSHKMRLTQIPQTQMSYESLDGESTIDCNKWYKAELSADFSNLAAMMQGIEWNQ